MDSQIEKTTLYATIGSVLTGILASLCCIGPLVFVLLGLSGAAFFASLEQYRWLFGGVAVGALALGFFFEYRSGGACAPGTSCEVNPRARKLNRIVLWIAAVLVAAFILSPNIIGFFVS